MSEVPKWQLEDPFKASHQAALDRAELRARDSADEHRKHRVAKKTAAVVISTGLAAGAGALINNRLDDDRAFHPEQGNPPNVITQQPSASLPENPGDLHITVPKK